MNEAPERPQPKLSTAAMLGLQFGIVVLAVLLALAFRIDLWSDMVFSVAALNAGVIGTVPMLLFGGWLFRSKWAWVRELRDLVETALVPLFRNAPAGTVFLVSLLAGVGEELLFRGVIQGGLTGPLGPWPALILASLLFGVMHALTRAYFIIATLMGFYLGWIYLRTGNLLIPILIHFLYDWVVLRYYLARQTPGGKA